ncbi:hypothetical protein N0V82_007530, partial [Gnomoniopsis sp. IMI 355080]
PPVISPSAVKFTRRPVKSSSLRKSINVTDDTDFAAGTAPSAADDDEEDARPTVIRPAVSRSGSTRIKKKGSSSRLSFGVTDDSPDASDPTPYATPKKNPAAATLTQRATENSALRASSAATRQLPTRSFGAEAPDRPTYSKEYLEELQSSTPNTPANLDSLSTHDDGDAMALDASELEGAVFVPSADATLSTTGSTPRHIPTATEIREKKERRARLAKEGNAYNSDASDNDDNYISLLPKKKKADTRLIAEDEDLGEGYDEFVEDGRLELGTRGASEAKRRQRREMAALINTAEGASGDDGDDDSDSDAERKAAYEAAQTRAAMDGLRGVVAAEDNSAAGVGRLVIPKMKPLPTLEDSVARLRAVVAGMEAQVAAKRARIQAVEREKEEIVAREGEVQAVLNEAGVKYQSAMGIASETPLNPEVLAAQSPLRKPGGAVGGGERGLESFGTPTRVEDGIQLDVAASQLAAVVKQPRLMGEVEGSSAKLPRAGEEAMSAPPEPGATTTLAWGTELGGGRGGPVVVCGSAGGFGEEEDGGFEVGGGDVLPEEVEGLDEALDGGVVLADGLVLVLGKVSEVDVDQALVGLVRGSVGDSEGRLCALILELPLEFLAIVVCDALEYDQQLRRGDL